MQLDIIRAIQHYSNPVLDIVMEAFTIFGEQIVLAGIFCMVYWCVDKRLGRYMALSLGISVCLNGVIKDIFKVERLFGADGVVSRRVETATGYSFPSNHSQTAAAFWGGLIIAVKRPALRVMMAFLILMIGFSRLYLGVHYPTDVIGGLVIGIICASALYYVIIVKQNRALTLLICLASFAAALFVGKSADTFKAAGTLAGISAGLYFEEKLVGFEVGHQALSKIFARYALGMALVFVVYIVPKLVLPSGTLIDILRYALTVFVATGFAPYVFKKIKL